MPTGGERQLRLQQPTGGAQGAVRGKVRKQSLQNQTRPIGIAGGGLRPAAQINQPLTDGIVRRGRHPGQECPAPGK